MKESAGVIIVLNKKNEEKKILICHPSNAKWYNSYSFPKGGIDEGIYLYVYYINDISEIGLKDEVIPKENLQLEEVDWAGFLTITESKLRLFYKSTSILNKI